MNCRICGHGYSSEMSSSIPVAYRDLCYACHQGIIEGGDKVYVIVFSLLERIEKLEIHAFGKAQPEPLKIPNPQKPGRCICGTGFAMNLSCPVHQ